LKANVLLVAVKLHGIQSSLFGDAKTLQVVPPKVRRVEFMAQRRALDIEGIGGVVSEKVIERGLVKNLSTCLT